MGDNDNPYSVDFGKIKNYVISTDGKRSNPPNYSEKNINELKIMIEQGKKRIQESEKGFKKAEADNDGNMMRLFKLYADEYKIGVGRLERKLDEKLHPNFPEYQAKQFWERNFYPDGGKRSRKSKPYKRSRKSKKTKRSRKSKKSKRSRKI